MAREVLEIDRLIEEGLTLYGQGDFEHALLHWEKALAIDPDNAQANSYVDYVRANYELLTNHANGEATSEGAPFGIAEDEAEYQIEIQPGEIKPTEATIAQPMFMDSLDEGWLIGEETYASTRAYPGPPDIDIDGRTSQELTMEIEADEPPLPEPSLPEPPSPPPRRDSVLGMDFEDETREYDQREHKPPPAAAPELEAVALVPAGGMDEFSPEITPGFGHPNDFQTPPGFGTAATGIKRPDLGFVKALPLQTPMTSTDLGLPERPRAPAKASQPPISIAELRDEAAGMTANTLDELTLEPGLPEDAPTIQRPPLHASDLDDLDLISSLPSPRPAPRVPQITIDTPLSGSTKNTKRDFPSETRPPAILATTPQEPSPSDVMPSFGTAQTQDFESTTQERHRATDLQDEHDAETVRVAADSFVVSAPTRDLGLREEAHARAEAAGSGRAESTRADVMLSFDPIDARATEIIEDVDETAPANEAPEDKTRRRITTLFEKAGQWSGEGDLERAVAAVDLALSEDPNSALAQKLIHRNRDTMMAVFQAYLGNLERTPQLARPLHELANAPISSRAAFLLSRIDGLLSIDEILDICGMPRLEAYRYLCQLFLQGILR